MLGSLEKQRFQLSENLLNAINNTEPVSGLSHDFYRYPARFSPLFAREMILTFTRPGDWVLDPYSGGGTSLVEAAASGRNCIGSDISSLAVFLGNVKTTIYSENDLIGLRQWSIRIAERLILGRSKEDGDITYQQNLDSRHVSPVRRVIAAGIAALDDLESESQRLLARCIWLRTGQWALDSRKNVPSVELLREQFRLNVERTIGGAIDFASAVNAMKIESGRSVQSISIQHSAIGLEDTVERLLPNAPKLVLTSPPYPGVHVLYHRWQVQGRRETPAPFWISGTSDGHGATYYTMGGRNQNNLATYYDNALKSFQSVAKVCDSESVVAQMIAFSNPTDQLPRYLEMMNNAGFCEINTLSPGGEAYRPWRSVPRRKWHATLHDNGAASQEVVLLHRLKAWSKS